MIEIIRIVRLLQIIIGAAIGQFNRGNAKESPFDSSLIKKFFNKQSIIVLVLFLQSINSASSMVSDMHRFQNYSIPWPTRSNSVAICISGQVGRWLPEQFVTSFIDANPRYHKYFFFNMNNESYKFSTNQNAIFSYGIDRHMKPSDIELYIRELYTRPDHSNVVSIHYHKRYELLKWKEIMGGLRLDAINQFNETTVTDNILNMYKNYVNCGHQIETTETRQGWSFQYIISTREDIYFYLPVYLDRILEDPANAGYDIFFRDCLGYGGFNMRMEIHKHDAGLVLLSSRLGYYHHLLLNRKHYMNPEAFEVNHASHFKFRARGVDVDKLAVTAARYKTYSKESRTWSDYCFLYKELLSCYPKMYGMADFVTSHLCFDSELAQLKSTCTESNC